jgi:cellular nucleic acid-binding protein
MVYIYILELENKKYYVGKTTNPDFRIESHFNSNGSAWTKKYKPIRLYQLIPDCDDYDEDKYTKIYMDKYGIDNVRGGSYSQINLDENTIESLLKMNQTITNKCYLCGKSGHFAKNCQKNDGKHDSKYKTTFSCEYCNIKFTDLNDFLQHDLTCTQDIFFCVYCNAKFTNKTKYYEHEYKCSKFFKNTCYRCGRKGHKISECYATTDINNEELCESEEETEEEEEIEIFCCYYCDKEFDTLKGATYHENFHCKSKNNKSKSSKQIEVFCCYYCDKEFDSLKSATCHQNLYCKFKNNKSKSIKEKSKKNSCYKCGREGHYSDDCYASKHVNGRYLN